MKKTLDNLWEKYFCEECAIMDTEEERALTKKAADLHKNANALLSKDQENAMEEFICALYDLQALFVKKAFFKKILAATSCLRQLFFETFFPAEFTSLCLDSVSPACLSTRQDNLNSHYNSEQVQLQNQKGVRAFLFHNFDMY